MGVGGDREMGGSVQQILKRGVDNVGGGDLHKIGCLVPFCQLCKETLKNSPPPSPITAILEKSHPPHLYEEKTVEDQFLNMFCFL